MFCFNVIGLKMFYYEIVGLMYEQGGLCFVDFVCFVFYIDINMWLVELMQYFDVIYFFFYKFLGGLGLMGILVFDFKLYINWVFDNFGGGMVDWINFWGGYKYIDEIEVWEDGGILFFL